MSERKMTALITGASSGLGKEYARLHASRGGHVVIVARREDKLNALKAELEGQYGVNVTVIAQDLSRAEAAQELYDAVQKQGIEIDYLINNAGFGGQGAFAERSVEDDMQLIAVDIVSLTLLTKLFLRDFLRRGSGRILNVASTAALMPGPLQATYYAAKSYVTYLSHAVWQEIQGTGVTITNLMPGGMATEFAGASDLQGSALAKQMTFGPAQVARESYEAMLRGKMNVISGVTWGQRVLFKLIPLLPRKVVMKQIYNMQQIK